MRKPKHDLDFDDFEVLMCDMVGSAGGDYDNKFIKEFCRYIVSGDTLDAIVCDLEDWFDDHDWNYEDDWKYYADHLSEYEDDDYVKHIVATEGDGDYIYKITGIEPEGGFGD